MTSPFLVVREGEGEKQAEGQIASVKGLKLD
jgi:hypothetical protein